MKKQKELDSPKSSEAGALSRSLLSAFLVFSLCVFFGDLRRSLHLSPKLETRTPKPDTWPKPELHAQAQVLARGPAALALARLDAGDQVVLWGALTDVHQACSAKQIE